MLSRRKFLRQLALGSLAAVAAPVVGVRRAEAGPRRLVKADLIVRSSRPLDLETPVERFASYLTPTEAFFVRSHHDEPRLEAAAWRLAVEGRRAIALSLAELRALPRHEVTAVLQCSGNGRAYYRPRVPGVPWERGAVGNARWAGARLADVLARAGLPPEAAHVWVGGADRPLLPATPRFTRSLPLAKALHPDTLLAWEMNGEPLPYLHGHPVRLVVPGWVGDDWVKWVSHLIVSPRPSEGFFYATAYRYPKAPVEPGSKVAPADMAPMTELVVKSLISSPSAGAVLRGGPLVVRGVAWTGGEARVVRVEVSLDGGTSWREASLLDPDRPYAWRRWSLEWRDPPRGEVAILARATDSRGAGQPVGTAPWNPSGYLWNACDRVEVHVDA